MLTDMKAMAENEMLLQDKLQQMERAMEGTLGGTDSQVNVRLCVVLIRPR